MLHPALLDFGEPWNYISALFAQSSGGSGSTAPTAVANGIQLAAGTMSTGYSTTQRVSDITPAAGKRLLVATRLQLSDLTDANLWIGAWEANGDPFNNPIPAGFDGVFIEKSSPTAAGIRGRRIKGGTPDNTTAELLTLTAGTFVDVAVLVLGVAAVQFLALRSDGAWAGAIIDTSIPTVPLRPSVAVQRSSLGASINCDVRSFFVHEES